MDNFKKVLDLDGSTPEPAARSGDTLFWQLLIDPWMLSMTGHDIDVQSVFSWAPKVVRKCESKHWCSCGRDGRSLGVRSRDYQMFLDG